MEEDDIVQQQEELLALQAIFGDRCVVEEGSCQVRCTQSYLQCSLTEWPHS